MSNDTSEGLPEGWRPITYGHGCTDDDVTLEVDEDGVTVSMMTIDGGHYGAKHEHTREVPTPVILWLADRLRPEAPSLTDAVREVVPNSSYSDTELLLRAVRLAHRGSRRHCSRTSHVKRQFAVGSTVAHALCIAAGVDPDEMVGGGR